METGRFLFRVLYYGSRVHLETFHVLTDGTGAMQFLKAVCYRYCQLAHPDAFTPEQLATPYGTETAGEVPGRIPQALRSGQKQNVPRTGRVSSAGRAPHRGRAGRGTA